MKILIGADLVPTENTNQLFVNQDFNTLFSDILPIIKRADRFIVNLECALTNSKNEIKKFGPCLKADPKCADALKALGVTDVALSNNHVFDFGIEGLKDTMDNLNRVGLPYMGIGANDTDSRKIYYFEQDNKKIAVVNVCEHEYSYALPDRIGTNPFDPFLTMQDVRKARKNADFVLVLYHGGKEHCQYPSPRLRNLCHELVLCGADAVITQHSHCIGCYEQFEGAHILYGQGNFHFLWNIDTELWNTSLLVELSIDKQIDIDFIPIISAKSNQGIELAKGEQKEKIINGFKLRSNELLNGNWKNGWHAFCVNSQNMYKNALRGLETPETMEAQTEKFAHYLDCEAHTDVWRELFPTWNSTNEK